MEIEPSSLMTIPTCFATCSIGLKTSHGLAEKIKAISAASFAAIELSFPDLIDFASAQCGKEVDPTDYDALCIAGAKVKHLCNAAGLQILMLQPFANFEGWPSGSQERVDAFERADGWIRIMQAVGTDLLQIGSSDANGISSSQDQLASDLRELADRMLPLNLRIAYENWCWATNAPTWKDVWEIVKKVNRPNVGLCLDTFQTAGSEWGDPGQPSGVLAHSGGLEALNVDFSKSMDSLSCTVPSEKIFLLQISDAYKPATPLDPNPDQDGLRMRGRWSHDYRPLPFSGGYLPISEVTRAVLRTGFRGWFSIEVFDGGRDGKGKPSENMEAYAKLAMQLHYRLLEDSANAS